MKPSREDVQYMVKALFTLTGGLERARRRIPDASSLAVLQIISAYDKIHPSEIASELGVHQSTITRHVQTLEDAGKIIIIIDPTDRRSCTLTLSEDGRNELARLTEIGLDRFAKFVADWDDEEVRDFTRYLVKLEESKAAVARQENLPKTRHWQLKKD
jgi:DNA-binding MarR family transcriptional regulator